MVDTGELENYLNEQSAKKGDIVRITGEGEIAEIPQKDGSTRKGLNLPVILNEKLVLTYSPGKTVMKEYKKRWGNDTKDWVNKQAKVTFMKMNVMGELKDILYLDSID